jgi:hypothetical protein
MQCQTEAFEATESDNGVRGSEMSTTLNTCGSRRKMTLGGWSLT